jgi:hypothetical protein
MAEQHKKRFEGTRWQIVAGSGGDVDKTALTELQRYVQTFHPYVVEICNPGEFDKSGHLIILGTPANSPVLKQLIKDRAITAPDKPEGYAITSKPSPFAENCRLVAIAGHDSAGALYGVMDFCARILATKVQPELSYDMRKSFDAMPDFTIAEHPLITNRGIWTWGYVIYDYRRFFDNMMKLKMNMVTIWNDCVPVNIAEIVSYAHARGIKIILGFHWGWGLDGIDISKPADQKRVKEMVVENYRNNYMKLDIDGIYFQTLTEHQTKVIAGKSVASHVCTMVNDISRALYDIKPGLTIQFGLHAMSIGENFGDLKDLDKRVVIVWEDAGIIPYGYDPSIDPRHSGLPEITTAAQTVEYSKKLAGFRKGTEFALVPKGWTNLSWRSEFEHHGPFVLGERDPKWVHRRWLDRQTRWSRINDVWLVNHPVAAEFYSAILDLKPPVMTVTGLVEDGMFEESIPLSVSVFGDTIWNPKRDATERLRIASSPFYG